MRTAVFVRGPPLPRPTGCVKFPVCSVRAVVSDPASDISSVTLDDCSGLNQIIYIIIILVIQDESRECIRQGDEELGD